MSQENSKTVSGVRYRVSLPPERVGARRTLDEQLFARVPSLYRLLAAAMRRLPTRSRLRRRLFARVSTRAVAAANRRDFEVLLLGFDPDIEYRPRLDWSSVLDLRSVFQLFRFRAGLVVWQRDFADRDQALGAVGLSE
jgi:hypothetical protein